MPELRSHAPEERRYKTLRGLWCLLCQVPRRYREPANAAHSAYRERFLYEKGGDLEPIVVDAEIDESSSQDDAESSIDVIGILESEGIVLDAEENSNITDGDDAK